MAPGLRVRGHQNSACVERECEATGHITYAVREKREMSDGVCRIELLTLSQTTFVEILKQTPRSVFSH